MRRLHLDDARLGCQRALDRVRDRRGQSTVEYLAVLSALLVIAFALCLLWRAGSDGVLTGLAVRSASHGAGQGGVSLLKDVLGY